MNDVDFMAGLVTTFPERTDLHQLAKRQDRISRKELSQTIATCLRHSIIMYRKYLREEPWLTSVLFTRLRSSNNISKECQNIIEALSDSLVVDPVSRITKNQDAIEELLGTLRFHIDMLKLSMGLEATLRLFLTLVRLSDFATKRHYL